MFPCTVSFADLQQLKETDISNKEIERYFQNMHGQDVKVQSYVMPEYFRMMYIALTRNKCMFQLNELGFLKRCVLFIQYES